uniref:Uncharacterized protein n=1 Tax=Anguilla anguilla TaxID=7936 RepID=A0A0E9PV18_ANGAN
MVNNYPRTETPISSIKDCTEQTSMTCVHRQ